MPRSRKKNRRNRIDIEVGYRSLKKFSEIKKIYIKIKYLKKLLKIYNFFIVIGMSLEFLGLDLEVRRRSQSNALFCLIYFQYEQ